MILNMLEYRSQPSALAKIFCLLTARTARMRHISRGVRLECVELRVESGWRSRSVSAHGGRAIVSDHRWARRYHRYLTARRMIEGARFRILWILRLISLNKQLPARRSRRNMTFYLEPCWWLLDIPGSSEMGNVEMKCRTIDLSVMLEAWIATEREMVVMGMLSRCSTHECRPYSDRSLS